MHVAEECGELIRVHGGRGHLELGVRGGVGGGWGEGGGCYGEMWGGGGDMGFGGGRGHDELEVAPSRDDLSGLGRGLGLGGEGVRARGPEGGQA